MRERLTVVTIHTAATSLNTLRPEVSNHTQHKMGFLLTSLTSLVLSTVARSLQDAGYNMRGFNI